ncbi:hypothetical protein Y032_0455g1771 [Ancylostoma ceylanicum]|uniref:ShKT domain-containing protein n=1 Tax=Ancylostoma ceylanicum TaxID=53326 RepID=A0A016WYC0_9BILA|nr:hypothetical protein Y032_0455g1771 [Ancylostoma ceylanicum]
MNRFILLAIVFISSVSFTECITLRKCYDNWSRCTPQTKAATGPYWKSCPDFCRQCEGRAVGVCARVYNKPCSGGYQCR